jgi:hypothetical protein
MTWTPFAYLNRLRSMTGSPARPHPTAYAVTGPPQLLSAPPILALRLGHRLYREASPLDGPLEAEQLAQALLELAQRLKQREARIATGTLYQMIWSLLMYVIEVVEPRSG